MDCRSHKDLQDLMGRQIFMGKYLVILLVCNCQCTTLSAWCFSVPTGVAVILAQFHVNHFRSIAWYNVILGILYILLQIAIFRGESTCLCENLCQKHKCSLLKRSKFRKMMTCSNVSLILVSLKWPEVALFPGYNALECLGMMLDLKLVVSFLLHQHEINKFHGTEKIKLIELI